MNRLFSILSYQKFYNITETNIFVITQETGFSSLNRIHEQFRYCSPVVQLEELYLRGMIHNGWQFYRNQGLKSGIHHQELTLFWYRNRTVEQLEAEILSSSIENVKYLQKGKRRLYFEV